VVESVTTEQRVVLPQRKLFSVGPVRPWAGAGLAAGSPVLSVGADVAYVGPVGLGIGAGGVPGGERAFSPSHLLFVASAPVWKAPGGDVVAQAGYALGIRAQSGLYLGVAYRF